MLVTMQPARDKGRKGLRCTRSITEAVAGVRERGGGGGALFQRNFGG
jgi:hypothetical protein